MRSVPLFFASAVLAIVAIVSLLYVRKVQRDFAAPSAMTMGVVLHKGALLGRRSSGTQSFCWVSYAFAAADGRTRQNRHFWDPACGTSPGRAIPIRYVLANPDLNRPDGSEPWFPSTLFFFASGVALVMAFLFRRSEEDERSDWRTPLALLLLLRLGGQPAERWIPTWFAASTARVDPPSGQSTLHFRNQTLRQIVHLRLGGPRLRVAVDDTLGVSSSRASTTSDTRGRVPRPVPRIRSPRTGS